MFEISEERLKEMGFYQKFSGVYRKDYPSSAPKEERSYSAIITRYWHDEKQGYIYQVDGCHRLYANGCAYWSMNEKSDIDKEISKLKTAFEEFKKDMKELRKRK